MKYYCETIPLPLADKLKEKGMPMNLWKGVSQGLPFISIMEKSAFEWLDKELGNEPSTAETRYAVPSYAEVFDWLAEKGIYISICHRKTSVGIEYFPMVNCECPYAIDGREWHHSAEKAIEKALELIK